MSDYSDFYDGIYDTQFKCNECGKIFTAVKITQQVCPVCMSTDLSKPSGEEMEAIIEDIMSE